MHHSDDWVKEVGCAGAKTKGLIHDSHLRLLCQTRVTTSPTAQRADLQEAEKFLQTLYCHLPENNIWLQLSESWLKNDPGFEIWRSHSFNSVQLAHGSHFLVAPGKLSLNLINAAWT